MPVVVTMSRPQFKWVIRQIKTGKIDRVKSIEVGTLAAVKRLGVKRDPTKAVRGIPVGPDQGNVRTILDWLDRVKPENKRAIKQVIAIDATAAARIGG